MRITSSTWRRGLAAALLAAGLGAGATHANSYVPPPYVKGGLVQVDVYDRFDRTALPVYSRDGQQFIVGAPGHEYAVRIRNCTGARILVVTSVDGVNVISGDTAAPSQSGYVLEPYGSVEIAGWRKSMERTAAFFFTEHQNSYAARTGRPDHVGVIGVAVFQERVRRIAWRDHEFRPKLGVAERQGSDAAGARADAPMSAAPAAPAPRQSGEVDEVARSEAKEQAGRAMAKLGTGHGRNEESRVTATRFERASETPAEVMTLRYDRRENLIAMGVLPQPAPRIARRDPNPFPGTLRFAPDPTW